MEFLVKANRTYYQKLRQTDLAVFAENIVNSTFEKTGYTAVQPQVLILKERTENYHDLLAEALTGSKAAIVSKDLAKQALIEALNSMSAALEMHSGGDPMYLLNAGMKLHKTREARTETVMPPYSLRAKATGVPGEALLRMKVEDRYEVLAIAVEWSFDGKTDWTNGTYHQGILIKVKDLPRRQEIFFRVRILATRDRKSAWTEEAVSAFVL